MGDRQPLLLFLRAHHLPLIVATIALLVVGAAVAAPFRVQVPTLEGPGAVSVPLPLQTPMIAVSILVGVLHGRARDWEECAGSVLRAAEARYLLLLGLSLPVLAGLGTAAGGGGELGLVAARATVIWLALAVLSGRLFGWQQAWILPLASFLPLSYLSIDSAGQYRWWYWPGQPVTALPCTLLAVALCAISVLAYQATPWRLLAVRRATARLTLVGSR